ncbi:membrane-spanning 4-domains subfamily A member 4A-like isoform X2 [Bufo gargarizans]|uniref:membrane-spanning 4-domains subfamily A member 4A-like isoform X2 n=1 Tax=Bufo gargarizans TaxID=30331 RepID=UPI001CF5243B|nr:membrane-spanning 4-domains subfamily A member 4A-like isoform X2 [Bufo gargarizans]
MLGRNVSTCQIAMSPVAPDAVVVITQVRPQNDQGNGPEELQSSNASGSIPKPVAEFYKGEPEVLGTTQIVAGIFLISIGIPMTIVSTEMIALVLVLISYIPFWSGILFIISGSLSVAASMKPTLGKVQASLVMNIFSSLVAISGMILAALDLSFLGVFFGPYVLRQSYCAHYKSDTQKQCLGAFIPMPVYNGVAAFFLMLFTLIFCITISTSVFACRTACRSSFHENIVVIYQTTSLNVSDANRDVPLDSTAALTSDLKAQT